MTLRASTKAEPRPLAWLGLRREPSLALSVRWAAIALMLFGLSVAIQAVTAGPNPDRWGLIVCIGLAVTAAWASVVLLLRYRVQRYAPWLWLGLGAAAWAAGQVASAVQMRIVHEARVPSVADAGFVAWAACSVAALLIHSKMFAPPTRWVYLVDAALLAIAAGFITWELAIHDRLSNPSSYPVFGQLLLATYPMASVAAAALLLLLLLIDRSPTRVLMFTAMATMTVASTIDSASFGSTNHIGDSAAFPLWAVGFAALAATAGAPRSPATEYSRPALSRLAVVHLPMFAAVVVAVWRYVVQDRALGSVSIVFGGLGALAVVAEQLAGWYYSSSMADQLRAHLNTVQVSEEELRALLNDLPDAVVVMSADGRIVEANALAQEFTGLDREEMRGRPFHLLIPPDDRQMVVDTWDNMLRGEPVNAPVFRFLQPSGAEMLLEGVVRTPVRDLSRIAVTLRDVSGRLRQEHSLDVARERFRLAFHGAPTGMALSGANDGLLLDVNESLATMLGYTRGELIGRGMADIVHPDDYTGPVGIAEHAATAPAERRYLRSDASVMWARTWTTVMDDGFGDDLAITHVEDITEERHSAERLEWAATHDELTRLPNRFRFLDQLATFLETSEPGAVAVMFIDLDNFKVINDSLGHGVGDELLRGMSERLRAVVRDRDMLSRFGGDEFIVMLRDVGGRVSPVDIAERLRAEIAQPLYVDGAELFVTASIGIAVADRPGVTTTDLLRDADAAMYRAKARGRNCIEVFSPGTHDATVLTLRTNTELRRGLERHEVVPYYQPIVQLDTGHLVGFEVLARWRHPDRGLLGPEQFLPMAEETGLIGEVGATVLRSTLAQLGAWREKIPRFADVTVSVNVSGRQLMSPHFHGMLAEALAESGLSADALWLEITETALMHDVKAATVALRELRSLGLHLSVDDFGTGYSSLTYLKRFPVEAIKVDRSFVSGLGIDSEDTTIVEAVVKLGHSLGLTVVAEGVETPLQLSRLRELRCDRGQGYVFGRPRPAELIESEYSLS